jgi:hypothetical protein
MVINMKKTSGKNFLAFAIFAVFIFASAQALSQSISELGWDDFIALTTKDDVRTQSDPFSRGAGTASDLTIEELQLSGIVYKNENDAYALISGYLLKAGDHIAGYRVDLVERDKVRLRRVDDIYVLALGGGI